MHSALPSALATSLSATRFQCSLVPARTKDHNHTAYLHGPPCKQCPNALSSSIAKSSRYTTPPNLHHQIESPAIKPLVGCGWCGMANRKAIDLGHC